jgi:hypothetical protein
MNSKDGSVQLDPDTWHSHVSERDEFSYMGGNEFVYENADGEEYEFEVYRAEDEAVLYGSQDAFSEAFGVNWTVIQQIEGRDIRGVPMHWEYAEEFDWEASDFRDRSVAGMLESDQESGQDSDVEAYSGPSPSSEQVAFDGGSVKEDSEGTMGDVDHPEEDRTSWFGRGVQ